MRRRLNALTPPEAGLPTFYTGKYMSKFAARGQEDWQPIETAPTDGTRFDVWLHHADGSEGRVVNCYCSEWDKALVAPDGWYLNAMKPYGTDKWLQYPTHWMPLPEPPHK